MAKKRALPTLSPRKLPTQERARRTYGAIVEAGARILERHGYEALTTNHVADLAGVGIASLYEYFPNKQALVAEIVRHVLDELLADLGRSTQLITTAPPAVALEASRGCQRDRARGAVLVGDPSGRQRAHDAARAGALDARARREHRYAAVARRDELLAGDDDRRGGARVGPAPARQALARGADRGARRDRQPRDRRAGRIAPPPTSGDAERQRLDPGNAARRGRSACWRATPSRSGACQGLRTLALTEGATLA